MSEGPSPIASHICERSRWILRPLRGRGRRNLSHNRSTKPLTGRILEAIRDWARLEQTRSELPLSRDGADALGQSAPMAACFQLWSPRSQCHERLRGDCSYRFDPRRLSSDKRAELPRLAPSKGFGAPSPATRPPLSPSIQPIRTSLSSGGDAQKLTRRGTGSDWKLRLLARPRL